MSRATKMMIEIDGQTIDLTTLDEREIRFQRDRIRERLTSQRALLNLQISGAIQQEMNRMGSADGVGHVEVIATVAGVPLTEIWKILASDFRPSTTTWDRIERVLTLCRASQSPTNVVAVRRLFEEMVALSRGLDLLTNRAMELARRRRGIELFDDATSIPPNSRPSVAAGATAHGAGEAHAPRVGSERSVVEYHCIRCGITSRTKSREDTCSYCGFWQVSVVGAQSPNAALVEPASDPDVQNPPPPAIPDLRGHDHRPDPLQATTEQEFVATMRAYRVWAGEPSLRAMEERCGKKISYSTFRNMLNATTVPKLPSLQIFVEVLGGTAKDIQRWTTAWRRFAMNECEPTERATDGGKVLELARPITSRR